MFYVYAVYTRPLSAQAKDSRSCHNICSLRYNSSLDTWTVVRLTAAKFMPFMFSVLGFALPYIAEWPTAATWIIYTFRKYGCCRNQLVHVRPTYIYFSHVKLFQKFMHADCSTEKIRLAIFVFFGKLNSPMYWFVKLQICEAWNWSWSCWS
jgi:hypothetical protein